MRPGRPGHRAREAPVRGVSWLPARLQGTWVPEPGGHGVQAAEHLQDQAGIRPVGSRERGGMGRHHNGEFMLPGIIHDRPRRGPQVRTRSQVSPLRTPVGSGRHHQHARNGRAADGHRVVRPDQAGRAILVRPRSAEVHRVDVIANALAGVLTKVVHRPAGRHLERIAAEFDGFHSRSRVIRGFVGDRNSDRLCVGLKTHTRDDRAVPQYRPYYRERAHDYKSHTATHESPRITAW